MTKTETEWAPKSHFSKVQESCCEIFASTPGVVLDDYLSVCSSLRRAAWHRGMSMKSGDVGFLLHPDKNLL